MPKILVQLYYIRLNSYGSQLIFCCNCPKIQNSNNGRLVHGYVSMSSKPSAKPRLIIIQFVFHLFRTGLFYTILIDLNVRILVRGVVSDQRKWILLVLAVAMQTFKLFSSYLKYYKIHIRPIPKTWGVSWLSCHDCTARPGRYNKIFRASKFYLPYWSDRPVFIEFNNLIALVM